MTYVVDVFVYLVGQHEEVVVAEDYVGQGLQLLLAVDASRWVAGRAEYQHPRLGRDGSLKLLGGHLEILLEAGVYKHRGAACQQHHLRIAHPVRSRDDNLVARVHECHDGIADALLGTVAHQNLRCRVVQGVLPLELLGDSLSQVGISGHGRIPRVVVVDGLLCCQLDVVGGVEVGFAHAHVYHVDALCFHFAALLRHGEGRRGGQTVESVG